MKFLNLFNYYRRKHNSNCKTPAYAHDDIVYLTTLYGHKIGLPQGRIPYQQGSLAKKGVYEPETTKLLFDILHPGMRVADCGSNCGYHAQNIAKIIGPEGRLWCFEANPELVPLLTSNMDNYGYLKHSTIINAGIWASDGVLPFPLLATGLGTASFKKPEQLKRIQTKVVDVPVVSLDSFFGEQKLDLIRMDIEGAELEALKGAVNVLNTSKPTLVFEWSHENTTIEETTVLFQLLLHYGYYVYRITGSGLIPVLSGKSLFNDHQKLCESGQRDIICSLEQLSKLA